MKNLKVGLAGLGVMGKNHLRVLSQLDGVDLVAVYDIESHTIPKSINAKFVSSLDELLSAGIDYCVVSAPTSTHFEIGLQLANRGIHALIEKPVTTNPIEARKLIAAFAEKNLIGGVGHVERFNPAIQAMREKIAEGLLGDVFQIATRRQGPFPPRVSDVGVVKDLATHDIDLTMWVMQDDYQSISSQTSHRSGRQNEDLLVAIGKLKSGVIVSHLVNWLSPFKERNVTIIGSNGALVADTLTSDLTLLENGTQTDSWDGVATFRGVSEGMVTRFALEKTEPLLAEHIAFRDAVRTRDTSGVVTFQQGLITLEVADRLLTS
jgi:predicted dehydrogenase